jgi:hypothetical protein
MPRSSRYAAGRKAARIAAERKLKKAAFSGYAAGVEEGKTAAFR